MARKRAKVSTERPKQPKRELRRLEKQLWSHERAALYIGRAFIAYMDDETDKAKAIKLDSFKGFVDLLRAYVPDEHAGEVAVNTGLASLISDEEVWPEPLPLFDYFDAVPVDPDDPDAIPF